jgi:HAD superfamily hydrolase (TIGR01662 family)
VTYKSNFTIDGLSGQLAAMLFDLDDTLVDRRGAFNDWARTSAVRWLQPAVSEETTAETTEYLVLLDNEGFTTRIDFFSELKQRYKNITESPEDLVISYYREMLKHMRLLNGADTLLATLRRIGVPFGIVTNGVAHQMDKAVVTGLTTQASCILISADIGVRKPHREMFLTAARRLNISAEQIAFVGDQPAIDVAGAHACGMRTIWIRNGRPWPSSLPSEVCDLAIDSLAELSLVEQPHY